MLSARFIPVQLQLCGTAPGRSPGGPRGRFSLLPPLTSPFLLLGAGLRVLGRRGRGSRWAPVADGLTPTPAANASPCRV